MNRVEMKMLAKQQISGNIGILFVCALIVGVVVSAASGITFGIGGIFVAAPMEISLCMIYLGLAKGTKPKAGDVFNGFEVFGKSVWLTIITLFFVWLWSMLFVIPGIIKSYSYAMAPYILAENNDMTAREALNESKRIMDGHKWEFFVLQLSFILWILLGSVTFGLAYIYVTPYMNMTAVNFYNSIKAPAEPVQEATIA